MGHVTEVFAKLLLAFAVVWPCCLIAETDATAELLREAEAILSGQTQTDANDLDTVEAESPSPATDATNNLIDPIEEDITESIDDIRETTSDIAESAVILLDETESPEQTSEAQSLQKDIILVLDNSGSMKENDPQFLASSAVREFISSMDGTTRVSVVIFDQAVRVAVPFTEASDSNKETLLSSLDQINYKGQFTDSPAAIERAIYDLKDQGREDVNKLIVFMTDGIVDTGKADMDLEKTRWLKDDLAADAADNEIQIFGIAFTEAADFQLIQSLAQKTGGEYYRALTPEDLSRVFDKINIIINTPPEPEPVPEPVVVLPPPPPPPIIQEVLPPPPPPEPVIIEVPVEVEDEDAKMRSTIIIAGVSVMIIALIAILILLMRKGRGAGESQEAPVHEAFINDIHGLTGKASYKLGSKPVMMGRVAGKDTEHLDYIVIPETTIGRRHALIEYKEFAFWIIDQGSINGTFVNDQPITAETRLKHGDRVRLHKFELEFTVPELAEDGMTVISNTVFAGVPEAGFNEEDAKTIARGEPISAPAVEKNDDGTEAPDFELEFDITSGIPDEDDEDETVLRVEDADITEAPSPTIEDHSDETIMLDDETLVPEDEDVTLRRKIDELNDEKFVETEEFNLNDLDKKE